MQNNATMIHGLWPLRHGVTELEDDHFRKRANRDEDNMNVLCQTRLTGKSL